MAGLGQEVGYQLLELLDRLGFLGQIDRLGLDLVQPPLDTLDGGGVVEHARTTFLHF